MPIFKTKKYRIYPNIKQSLLIDKTIGTCRLVYNLSLKIKKDAWGEQGKKISSIDLINQLPELKKDFPWISEVDSQALQSSIRNLDNAFNRFYSGSGFPKFKKKANGGSFQCPNNARHIDFEKELLTIPKIPNIPIRSSCRFEGEIKTVTISKTNTGKYFASILVETPDEMPSPLPITEVGAVGIDLGIKDFAVLSTGEKVEGPKALRSAMKRLKVLQRRASRKKKGSANRKKANHKVAIQHEKIANQRKDFLQKLSTRLIRDSQTDTVCVESLAVKNMVKNHSLAQAISDASWSEFVRQLQYKAKWYGKNLIKIDRFAPSSKTCSSCGHKNDGLTLSEREWECSECHVTHDRDVNAAINIKLMGLNNSGADSSGVPVEPLLKRRRRSRKALHN